MKCQILFSEKNVINVSSAELAQRVVKIKQDYQTMSLESCALNEQ